MAEWPDLRPILWPEVRFYCERPDVHYTKITVKQEKTATEVLLLRFVCGATGTTFKESNERLTMLMY